MVYDKVTRLFDKMYVGILKLALSVSGLAPVNWLFFDVFFLEFSTFGPLFAE